MQIISCEESFMSAILQCNNQHFRKLREEKVATHSVVEDREIGDLVDTNPIKALVNQMSL